METNSLFTINKTVSLSNKRLTKKEVELNGDKILIIGRPEIGGKIPFEESLALFKENLLKHVEKSNATDVFVLGKIVATTKKEEIEDQIPKFLKFMEDFPTKLHLLSATDERMTIGMSPTDLDVIKEYAGIFHYKNPENDKQKTFYVCDDMGNSVNVASDAGCAYLIYLKENFTLPWKDFLISGHVSPAFIELAPGVISPGKFNYECGKIEYALISLSDGIEMEIFTDIDTEDFNEQSQAAHPESKSSSKRQKKPASPDCTCYI